MRIARLHGLILQSFNAKAIFMYNRRLYYML